MASRASRKVEQKATPRERSAEPLADSRARRYDPAETRTRVLEAAYMLFGTRGYAATGTADIARAADVSEGSIFYHFGSKRALLVELGKLHGEKMVAAMQRDDAMEDVTFAVSINRCFDFCEANSVWDEVIHEGECPMGGSTVSNQNPDSEPFFHAAREVVTDFTRRHLEAAARVRKGPKVDSEIAASLVFALVGDAMQRYFAPGTTPEQHLRIRREVIRFLECACGDPDRAVD